MRGNNDCCVESDAGHAGGKGQEVASVDAAGQQLRVERRVVDLGSDDPRAINISAEEWTKSVRDRSRHGAGACTVRGRLRTDPRWPMVEEGVAQFFVGQHAGHCRISEVSNSSMTVRARERAATVRPTLLVDVVDRVLERYRRGMVVARAWTGGAAARKPRRSSAIRSPMRSTVMSAGGLVASACGSCA